MNHEECTLKLKLTHINNWIAPLWQITMLIYALCQPMVTHTARANSAILCHQSILAASLHMLLRNKESMKGYQYVQTQRSTQDHMYMVAVLPVHISKRHHCTFYVHNCLQQHNITQENCNRGMHIFFPL